MKLCSLSILLILLIFGSVGHTNDIYRDARDNWSLMHKGLLNRQLPEQLNAPNQTFRYGKNLAPFSVAADASTGGQQSLPGTRYDQTRFHGYFILDTYGSLRLFDTLDVNLNLNFINPSFCDGYHESFQLLGGLSIHWRKTLLTLKHKPLRFDALLMDLDSVTVGEGLLIEQIPLEGFSFSLSWNNMSLSALIAARVFWNNDDFLAIPLKLFNGQITLLAAFWYFTEVAPDTDVGAFDVFRSSNKIQEIFPYVGIAAHHHFDDQFGIAAEYLLRLKDGNASSALLLRGDYKNQLHKRVNLHVGYQFRFYQQRFAPSGEPNQATTAPQLPERENSYVTNSFEYFSISPWYHQLSHTVMTEVQLHLTKQFQLFYELEYWMRWVNNTSSHPRVLYVEGSKKAPGVWKDIFYHMGFRYRLFAAAPHQVSVFVSNKWVASDTKSTSPMPIRYINDPLFGFELEVFL